MQPLSSSGNVKQKLTKAVFRSQSDTGRGRVLNVTSVYAVYTIFEAILLENCLLQLFILVSLHTWNYPRNIREG